MGAGKNSFANQRWISFDPAIVIAELLRLKAERYIVGRFDVPISIEQWKFDNC